MEAPRPPQRLHPTTTIIPPPRSLSTASKNLMSISLQGASSSSGRTGFHSGPGQPTSREQSIPDQIRKLSYSIDTLSKRHEKSPVTKEKIDIVLERLHRLGLGKNNEDAVDEQESTRRDVPLSVLNRIEGKLRDISARIEIVGNIRNEEDTQVVSELMDDIRDAILDYQTVQQKTTYDQNIKLIDEAEWSVLNGCRRAHGVEYRHGNRTGCLKGTRETVLIEIEGWATEDSKKPPIFWLNGLAGTGKSTIAQTIAERLFAGGRLGASFFCSRGVEDHSDLRLIFPSLAFQLAQKYPTFRSSLIPILRSNADVVHEALQSQMQRLIVEPLLSARISTVIVLDALDECRDEDPESAILLVLGQSVSDIPGIRFFITSRPERHITSGFRGPLLRDATDVFVLHDVELRIVDNDIRRFFRHELFKLARQREGWPTDGQLDSLCRRAAGFFVYAVATVNFLKHKFKRPSDRLDIIMKSPESTAYEGQAGLKVYSSLDTLYNSILRAAFLENDADDDATVRSVLSAVVLVANPLPPSAIATLMDFECDVVLALLESIRSLLVLHDDIDHPVQPFHKSFPDFITGPTRCTDTRFHISADYHIEIVLRCLELMYELLEKNMCSMPDYALNSDVKDLSRRIEEGGIHGALEYACRSWYKHLNTTQYRAADVISALNRFLEGRFLFWLEVLSVLGAVGDAARALSMTVRWLNGAQVSIDPRPVLNTVTDCLRFVTEFFEVISQSGPHIYHSALLLSPSLSTIQNFHRRHIPTPVKIVSGVPPLWDSCTASAGAPNGSCDPVWSTCGRFIAIGFPDVIELRDPNTLERISTFKPPSSLMGRLAAEFAFSPDESLLACIYHGSDFSLVIWDIQTGVVIKDIKVGHLNKIAFSWDQWKIALTDGDTFCVYDGLKGAPVCEGTFPSPFYYWLGAHWTQEGSLWLAASNKTDGNHTIDIFKLRLTPNPLLHVVESFPVPPYDGKFSFCPISFHAAFVNDYDIVILDVRGSKILLQTRGTKELSYRRGDFSADGHLFACKTDNHELSVWWNVPTSGYLPWSTLRPRLSFYGFRFSPTGTSILTWGYEGVQALDPNNRLNSRLNLLSPNQVWSLDQHRNLLVAYSTDVPQIVTAWQWDSVITVLHSRRGTPKRSIDAEMEILDIKIINGAVFAVGTDQLRGWDLEKGAIADTSAYNVSMATLDKIPFGRPEFAALSNDGSRVALAARNTVFLPNATTQGFVERVVDSLIARIRFSPDGHQLWAALARPSFPLPGSQTNYSFVKLELEDDWRPSNVELFECDRSWVSTFRSPRGFHVGRGSEWVVDSEGRKLLWLPPSWRVKDELDAKWDGNFLAFVGDNHRVPIIIELQL